MFRDFDFVIKRKPSECSRKKENEEEQRIHRHLDSIDGPDASDDVIGFFVANAAVLGGIFAELERRRGAGERAEPNERPHDHGGSWQEARKLSHPDADRMLFAVGGYRRRRRWTASRSARPAGRR